MWKVNEDGFMECTSDFRIAGCARTLITAGTIGAKLPEKCTISNWSWIEYGCQIHENVVVCENTLIKKNSVIGPGSKIGSDCIIGFCSKIGSDCEIYESVILGADVNIRNQVTIYNRVIIGDDSIIRCGTKIHRQVKIGQNVRIHETCEIERGCTIGNNSILSEDCHLLEAVKIGEWVHVGRGTGIRTDIHIPNQVEVPEFQWIEPDNFMVFVNQGTRCRPVFMMFDSRASSKTAGDVMVTVGCQDCITFTKFLSRIKNAIGTTDKSALMYRRNIPLFKAARKRIILNRARSVTKRILVHLGF